jgi:hypothetical protein
LSELRDVLELSPQVPLTAETLTRRRADALALLSSVAKPNLPDIVTGEIHVESAFGAKPIRVLTYRPVRSDDPLPVIVHIHGGGFVMGAPEMKDVENRLFAAELRCAIWSVDHRLAPEAPHPAPVEDIYSVFVWLHANANQLGLDPDRFGMDADSVNFIDTSACDAVLNVIKELQSQGIIFAFARVRDNVREQMRLGGIEAAVGSTNFHERVTDGVRAWQQQARRDAAAAGF